MKWALFLLETGKSRKKCPRKTQVCVVHYTATQSDPLITASDAPSASSAVANRPTTHRAFSALVFKRAGFSLADLNLVSERQAITK